MREPVWFKLTTTTQAATIAAGSCKFYSIDANNTNIRKGIPPSVGIRDLRGVIEQIVVWQNTTAPADVEIVFCSAASFGTSPATDKYIDHESFPIPDFLMGGFNYSTTTPTWEATTGSRASKSGLSIPYFSTDSNLKFNVAVINTSAATDIAAKTLQLNWSWRPRIAEE